MASALGVLALLLAGWLLVSGALQPEDAANQAGGNSSVSWDRKQSDLVAAVKKHVLQMLHLSAPPLLTQTVPRPAMLHAIAMLHGGILAQDGGPRTHEERQDDVDDGDVPAMDTVSELIFFAGRSEGTSWPTMTFDLTRQGHGSAVVDEANVWIFVNTARGRPTNGRATLRLLLLHSDSTSGKEAEPVSERLAVSGHSGWLRFPLRVAVQILLDAGRSSLSLRLSCASCVRAGLSPVLPPTAENEDARQPFLVVALRSADGSARQRLKRGLQCDSQVHVCCKQHFYVSFEDIGWSDWIIAPPGYHLNYCSGSCPANMAATPGSSQSFHATVIDRHRLQGHGPPPSGASCCVPTGLRAVSMLYYNEEQKIIKRDVEDMMVEECGCS